MKISVLQLIIATFLLTGCTPKEIYPKGEVYDFKVDSVIKKIFDAKDFPDKKLINYAKTKDSFYFINELAPLSKKVYYPSLDLTFEYRVSYDPTKDMKL